MTNAKFGCLDGEHKAWIIVEVDSKEEAKFILPPVYQPKAGIAELNKFSLEEINKFLDEHPD